MRHTLIVAPAEPFHVRGAPSLHPSPLFTRHRRLVGQDIHDRRIEALLQEGQELGAHPIARHANIVVRLVVDEGDPSVREIGAQIRAPAVEQRPHERAAPRMHRGQPASAGAAQEPQKKRLRLVVARMAERDDIGLEVEARAFEKLVARRASRVFDRTPIASSEGRHVGAIDQERTAD